MTAQNIRVPPLWNGFNLSWPILRKTNPHLNGIVFEELVLDLNAKSLFEELPRLDRVDKASHPPEQHLKTTLMCESPNVWSNKTVNRRLLIMLVICIHMSDGGEKKDKEKNTDMSDGGDNFSESVSGVRSSSMILLFQESELLHLKVIDIKYSNDAICWYIDDDDDEKGGEMKSPWFEERLARPPPPFHLHLVITELTNTFSRIHSHLVYL